MKDIIRPEQVGFIKGRNIEVPLHTIDSVMKQASSSFSIAVDFEKAFDSLNHDYLLSVLQLFKFPDKFILLITKFLSLGKSCLRSSGVLSTSFSVERGVRQGDPLSGLLFVIALEPLLCALYEERYSYAPKIGHYAISHSAFADDLTVFCRKATKVKIIYNLLTLFERASGLRVNNLKTEIQHPTYSQSTISTWPVVRTTKILGILFPTKSRLQINNTIETLHGQLSFWKTLKLPLFTIITLINTYNKFQYTLPILDYDARDIKRVNKLIRWAIGNDPAPFDPTKRYNPLFSAPRCLLSHQRFGFAFELKLQKARLARIARIMKCVSDVMNNIPDVYFAQNLISIANPDNIFKIKPIPPTIRKHVMLWRRKRIDYEPSDIKPSASTFHNLLNFKPPHLHQTPDNVPSLKDWPRIKKLHIPPSTKSFLFKVFMNALPTSNRLSFNKSISVTCPLCSSPLSSSHFFKEKCSTELRKGINEWTKKKGIATPRFRFNFIDKNSNYNLILINSLWKTVCALIHSNKTNLKAQRCLAKQIFKRELRIASILFPSEYPRVGKFTKSITIHDTFNFVGSDYTSSEDHLGETLCSNY